jgi:drug/metabolite transporter (DMT)-like permease
MDKTSPSALLFILLTLVFTVVGQLLVKRGLVEVGAHPSQLDLLPGFLWQALTNWKVIAGLAAAVIAALSWMVAVSRSDLSFAYPFMALAIVLVLALSGVLFQEQIPFTRWIGVLVVCLGIFIASRP